MLRLLLDYFSFYSIKSRINNKRISLLSFFDKDSIISPLAKINRFVFLNNSSIGAFSFIGHNSKFNNVKVGKYSSISANVYAGLYSHPINFFSTSPIFYRPKNGSGTKWVNKLLFDDEPKIIDIGNDVWIGINVTIISGVKIGDGAIIASHSVVTKDVPPYAIYGGVPAKFIRYRFEYQMIDSLLKLKWWHLPISVLKRNAENLAVPLDNYILDKLNKLRLDGHE